MLTSEQVIQLQKLIEFKSLHEDFMQNRESSKYVEKLIEMDAAFAKKIILKLSMNVIPSLVAHGTNAWALFSAFAFSNGQLLPHNGMKMRGISMVAGEFVAMCKVMGDRKNLKYRINQISRNFVSTVRLKFLSNALYYAQEASHSDNYDQLEGKLRKMYNRRGKDKRNLLEKMDKVFDNDMQLVYEKLSSISVVILGDGIGETIVRSDVQGELAYERVNIRIIIVDEQNKEFIQDLIKSISPETAESIVCLTTQEISNVKEEYNIQAKENPKRTFIDVFLEAFKERLPFEISADKFQEVMLEKEVLLKKLNQDQKPVLSIRKCVVAYHVCHDINMGSTALAPIVPDQQNDQEKPKKEVRFNEQENQVKNIKPAREEFINHFKSRKPEEALLELQNSLEGLKKSPHPSIEKEIKLREDLIKYMQEKIQNESKNTQYSKSVTYFTIAAALSALIITAAFLTQTYIILAALIIPTIIGLYGWSLYKEENKPDSKLQENIELENISTLEREAGG